MFNSQRILSLERKIELLIEDVLEDRKRIMELETQVVLLKRKAIEQMRGTT